MTNWLDPDDSDYEIFAFEPLEPLHFDDNSEDSSWVLRLSPDENDQNLQNSPYQQITIQSITESCHLQTETLSPTLPSGNQDENDQNLQNSPYQQITIQSITESCHLQTEKLSPTLPSGNQDFPGTPPKARKRVRRPELHIKTRVKVKRNLGEEYLSESNQLIPAKELPQIFCVCKKQCATLFTEDERKQIFDSFWEIGDFKRQNAYLCGLVSMAPIERRRPRYDRPHRQPKSVTYEYSLQLNTQKLIVCKQFFLKVFCISDGRLTRALAKLRSNRPPGEDLRGSAVNSHHCMPVEIMNKIRAHINSFPAFQSHYTRAHNPERKYLCPDLNVAKMYRLYVEQMEAESLTPCKEKYYRHIFNTKFNLAFHHPRKDTCKTCDRFQNQVNGAEEEADKLQLQSNHDLHLRKAEEARQMMRADGDRAKTDNSLYVCSIDLQKALPYPVLTVSEAYYRRNMYCYNLGVHDLATKNTFFHVWDQTEGKRGSQEIAACLVKHFSTLPPTIRHIIIYSDTCTGQNRNLKLALCLLKFVSSHLHIDRIEQKFLVSGHSFLPNDSDFGSVETAARSKIIFTPEDWFTVMRTCRHVRPFTLVKMQREEFLSAEPLIKGIVRRKEDTTGEPVNWLTFQRISYEKNKPFSVLCSDTLDPAVEYREINMQVRRGRPRLSLESISQYQLYTSPIPVAPVKKEDMLALLKYIPPVHHCIFTCLSVDGVDDIGPLDEIDEDFI